MKLLSDEQLSLVLSEHSAGRLARYGGQIPCLYECLYEAADGDSFANFVYASTGRAAVQFDCDYDCDATPEEFLALVERCEAFRR